MKESSLFWSLTSIRSPFSYTKVLFLLSLVLFNDLAALEVAIFKNLCCTLHRYYISVCPQCVQTLHQKDGPPLSLGEQLRRREQPEILCPLHGESWNTRAARKHVAVVYFVARFTCSQHLPAFECKRTQRRELELKINRKLIEFVCSQEINDIPLPELHSSHSTIFSPV